MKTTTTKGIVLLGLLIGALAAAGCTSPTTNTTSTSPSQNVASVLDAHFAQNYTVVANFSLIESESNALTYSGVVRDHNGTVHFLTIFLANTTTDAQRQFEDQKVNYADSAASPGATISANTSTHWAVVMPAQRGVSIWLVEPKSAGPFGLSLDSPYVLVSADTKPP